MAHTYFMKTLSDPGYKIQWNEDEEEEKRPPKPVFKRSISESLSKAGSNLFQRTTSKIRRVACEDIIFEREEDLDDEAEPTFTAIENPPCEVRIDVPEQEVATNKQIHHYPGFGYRRIIPRMITAHHAWLVIHFLVTILLLVLYFTNILQVSAGVISICELLVGVLVRNEIFVAYLHRLIALTPIFKYEFNRMLHCIGGIHVSCACAAFGWLLISLAAEKHGLCARITGSILLTFILFISATAIPVVRRKYHNTFEYIHRYAGWTSLAILLVHVIFLQLEQYPAFNVKAIINVPVFVLIFIFIIIVLPWLWVRRVPVQYMQPSKDVTVVTFPGALYPYGSVTRISDNGREWHAFAIALTNATDDEHSVVIATAGDWTRKLAEDYRSNQSPNHMWIRRIKGLGFMYSIHAYRKVLIVCTGSGIAPALPYIKDSLPTTHSHLLWISRNHQINYGDYIWSLVQQKFPHVTLHDTHRDGRPGPELVEETFWRTKSEAIFVVSNEPFTNTVVNAMWERGIPCFGALFDS